MKRDRGPYELFVRPLLFSLDAETAHHLTIKLLGRASHIDVALRALMRFRPASKPITVIRLDSPPGWIKTLSLFLRGLRSASVLLRLER